MTRLQSLTFTSFDGVRRIAAGGLQANALAIKQALDQNVQGPVLMFDDLTGYTVELDLRGSEADVIARLPATPLRGHDAAVASAEPETETHQDEPRGRGRPKLGVVAREVTLLPRHWEWLEAQPGGASPTLRKLVEAARKANTDKDRRAREQERAYRFLSAVAGNMPHFEEASRALFANDERAFQQHTEAWPMDVRDYARYMAFRNHD